MGIDTIFYLGGLALLDTLSPTIIGVTLFLILTDNKNLTSRLLSYLFTVAILYFSLGTIMMLSLDYIMETFSNIFQSDYYRWILFGLGIILFVGSYFIPKNRQSNVPKPKTQSIFSMVLIGIATFLIEAGTALPYFAAIGLVTNIDIPFYEKFSIIAVYNIIMILPALIIFLGYKLFSKRINSTLVNLRNKISGSSNSVLSWIMCIVGVILVLYSIDGLNIVIK